MIKVILADHERIFRIGMASALASEDDICIVGQPSSVFQLVNGIQKFRPNVLIISSMFLGRLDMIGHACRLQHTAILFVQDYGGSSRPVASDDFEGVICRAASQKTVLECVRHLARGGRVVRLGPPVVQEPPHDAIGMRVRERLSPRELGIVSFVAKGYKNREIAARLGTSEQAVKNNLRHIFDKTGVYGRLELALFVMHHRSVQGDALPEKAFRTSAVAAIADLQQHWNGTHRFLIR
jgi:DNA-binding NarL/FixJ family response regulator